MVVGGFGIECRMVGLRCRGMCRMKENIGHMKQVSCAAVAVGSRSNLVRLIVMCSLVAGSPGLA